MESANSKWKLENETREMGYVKLKIEDGTWEIANGNWKMKNRK